MSDQFDDAELEDRDEQNRFRAAYRVGAEVVVNGRRFRVTTGEQFDGSGGRFVVEVTPAGDVIDQRSYALKVSPAGADDRGAEEARVLARFDHPNVTRFVDAETTPTASHILVEWCDAGTFGDHWEDVGTPTAPRDGRPAGWVPATVRDILRMFLGALDGLAHVHGRGEYHLDLKPSNVLVKTVRDESQAKVSDFDVSRQKGMGTHQYAAPGQWQMDPRAQYDVIAMGHTLRVVLRGGAADGPRPPHLDPGLWAILRRAATPGTSGFERVTDFRNALAAYLDRGRVGRARAAVAGVVLALLAGAATAVVGWVSARAETERVAQQSVTIRETISSLGDDKQLKRMLDSHPEVRNGDAGRQLLALLRRAYDQPSLPGVDDHSHAVWRVKGYSTLGDTYRHIGMYSDGSEAYKSAVNTGRAALDRHPQSDELRRYLVGALRGFAGLLRQNRDPEAALVRAVEAADEAARLVGDGFDNRKAKALSASTHALILRDMSYRADGERLKGEVGRRFDEVVGEWKELRYLATDGQDRVQLSREYNNRANFRSKWKELPEAMADHRAGLKVIEDTGALPTGELKALFEQIEAQHRNGLGSAHMELGHVAEAERELTKSRELRQRLRDEHGGSPQVCADLASTWAKLAELELKKLNPKASLAAAEAGLTALEVWGNSTERVLEVRISLWQMKSKAFTRLEKRADADAADQEVKKLKDLQTVQFAR